MCNRTSLSKNAMSNYISGNRVPDTNAIYRISTALNVSIEWLLTGKETLNNDFEKISDEEVRILSLYRKLNSIERNKIEGMLEMKVFESDKDKKTTL